MLRRLSALAVCALIVFALPVQGGRNLTGEWHMPQGSAAGTPSGDWVSDADAKALTAPYRYFIEVPANATKLVVELFDADVGIDVDDDIEGRDRNRGGYDTTATYRLFNPAGVAVTPRFTTGNNVSPVGADNAWMVWYSATGNNVLDQFTTSAYTNNNGNNNWAGAWTETDGGGGGAATGSIRVTGGDLRLQDIDTGNQSIYREADLLGTPGLNMSMALLTFDYTTSGNLEAADTITLEVSANGGGAWTTLQVYAGNVTGTASFDITPYIANNTRIRFTVAPGEFDQNTNGEFFFVDDVRISDGPAITAGHWELQIDQTAGGDDINAIGISAHDGDSTSGGTEYNVYGDSMISLGVNPDTAGGNTRSYTLYPWVTSGCSSTQNDFDRDTNSGDTGSVTYTSRLGFFSQTFTSGVLSGEDVWAHNTFTNYTNNFYSIDYGIWRYQPTINTYINNNGNYETMYVGNYLATAADPGTNPLVSGAFPATHRIYLPTDAGVAPVKPWLEQYLTRVGGPGPIPTVGTPQSYTVSISVVNNTPHSITFSGSATNRVISRVPGAGTVYSGPAFSDATQGTILAEPGIGGTGNVEWNPGTVLGGTVATLSYNVIVTPAGVTTPATGTPAAGTGTRAQYVDETGNTTQARATYRLGELCQLNVVTNLATAVMLSSFEADRGRVAWTTASEAGTVGFNLYREDGSKVNDALIPAGKRNYTIDDRHPAERYIVEEITADGKSKRYGPLASMHRLGPDVKKELDRPMRIRASAEAKTVPDPAKKTVAVMVGVNQTGVVRVPFTELAARFGSTVDKIAKAADKRQLAISTGGQDIAYTSNLNSVLFFGERHNSIYSYERMYRIEETRGTLMPTTQVPPSGAGLSTFVAKVDVENDVFPATALPLDPESDYWFSDYIVSGDATNGRKTITINAPYMAATDGATLEVRLQGAITDQAHAAHVTVNGVPVGDVSWTSLGAAKKILQIPTGVLVEGANQVEVEGVLDPETSFDIFYIDGFALRYKRFARPAGGSIEATVSSAVTAGPFATEPMVLDITQRRIPVILTGGAFSGGNVALALPSPTKTVFVSDQFVTPSSYRSSIDTTFKNMHADYIVVAPASMRTGAEALASLRQAEGLRTYVASLEQIYDLYSDGDRTPHAIREFIGVAMKDSVKPRYVVLAGTGTVDYRGIEQSPGPVPPLMIKTLDGLFASDTTIADANEDGLPDVAIGRIPVSNNAELLDYVDKLDDHTATITDEDPIIFTADANDGETNFGVASDEAAQPLLTRPRERLHIGEIGPVATRTALLDAWSAGTPLVSWVGHGGLDQLSSAGVLTAGDVPSLLATGRLPVLVAMTCTINRFEDGLVEPLGAALTRQSDGGALAVWSATGLSNHEDARVLQRTFMRLAAGKPQLRLGDLIVQTLAAHPSQTAGIYVLLGDPAITMQLPKEMTNGGTPTPTGE
jgi:hypothetical protein